MHIPSTSFMVFVVVVVGVMSFVCARHAQMSTSLTAARDVYPYYLFLKWNRNKRLAREVIGAVYLGVYFLFLLYLRERKGAHCFISPLLLYE